MRRESTGKGREMRKRMITAAAVLCISSTVLVSAAEPATQTRGLVEFCETYVDRVNQFNDIYGIDLDGMSPLYTDPFSLGGRLMINHASGTMLVDKEDLRITEFWISLWDNLNDDNENIATLERCILCASCLEKGYPEEQMHGIMYNAGIYEKNFISMFFDTFQKDVINPYRDVSSQLVANGDAIHLYSGNYDYSVDLAVTELDGKEHKFVTLNVTAREAD